MPWALIAGTATADQVGATASLSHLRTNGGFELRASGIAIGIKNRLEVSLSRLRFGLADTVPGQSLEVDTIGIKVRLAGDAVYDQDSPWPQVSLGLQHKRNRTYDAVPRALGASAATGTDFYLAATKIWLAGFAGRNLLASAVLRASNANQFGILGFGGPNGSARRILPELSGALFLTDQIALGVEYRAKPNQLPGFREQPAHDLFVAWIPSRYVSVTSAYINLGNIANKPNRAAWYLSVQLAY